MAAMKIVLVLALLAILRHAEASVVFAKRSLDNKRWNGSQTDETSFVGCSIKCKAAYPTCSLFAWLDDKCYHGKIIETFERSDTFSEVFVAKEDRQRLLLLDTVVESEFNPNIYVNSNWTFYIGQNLLNHSESKAVCNKIGGHFLTLQEESAMSFYNAELRPEFDSTEGVWLGLDASDKKLNNCNNEQCNDRMVWEDGQTFLHQPFYSKTEVKDRRNANKPAFIIKRTAIFTSRESSARQVICQVRLT